jgi:hypothetical protein
VPTLPDPLPPPRGLRPQPHRDGRAALICLGYPLLDMRLSRALGNEGALVVVSVRNAPVAGAPVLFVQQKME